MPKPNVSRPRFEFISYANNRFFRDYCVEFEKNRLNFFSGLKASFSKNAFGKPIRDVIRSEQ